MKTTKSNSAAIHSLIEDFAEKLDTLIRADIIRALAEIVGAGATAAVKAGKTPKTTARGKGAKRDPNELKKLEDRLYAYISKHPGQRIEQIGEGMGETTKSLTLPLKKLQNNKLVKSSGQKRATTYRQLIAKG
jgi:hypothetical protein